MDQRRPHHRGARPARAGAAAAVLACVLLAGCRAGGPAVTPGTTANGRPATTTSKSPAAPGPTTTQGPPAVPASLIGTEWSRLPTTRPVVALTFDAGANDAGVPAILATLRATATPATFFLTGQWVRDYPAAARQIGAGYPVGDHTWTHPHLTSLSDAQVRQQVLTGAELIRAATGRDTRPLFRFPFGDRDARTISLVNALGYGSIRWTVDTLGWMGTSGGQSVTSVVARVMADLQPGEIVLMHVGSNPQDGSTLDASALATVIAEVRARGYHFVTVDDVIGAPAPAR